MVPIRHWWLGRTYSTEDHWNTSRTSGAATRPSDSSWIFNGEAWNSLEPGLKCHLHLHPGEIGSGASVNSNSEGKMPIVGTVELHRVRIVENLWVVVSRRKVQQNLVSALERNSLVVDFFQSVTSCSYGRIKSK